MNRYTGLDVHAASCTMVVLTEAGKPVLNKVVETNAAALVAAVKDVSGKRHVLMEEGTQSAWLYEVLKPHVAECVVIGVGRTRKLGNKSDARDAHALAEQMRTRSWDVSDFKEQGSFRARFHPCHGHGAPHGVTLQPCGVPGRGGVVPDNHR